ncbi:hypothetical protein NN561_006144 [Cricetulus griseus]
MLPHPGLLGPPPRGAVASQVPAALAWAEASAAPGHPRAGRPHPAACPRFPVPGEPDDGARPLWGNSTPHLDPDRGGGARVCGSVIPGRPWRLPGPSKTQGSWRSAQETLVVEPLPDSHASEGGLHIFESIQEAGPGTRVETPRGSPFLRSFWCGEGPCGMLQTSTRAYPTRDCKCGTLAVGVPTGESRSRKARGSLRRVPGPPLAVALATTLEGKSKSFSESGPQSPFRRRTHLAWPLFNLSTQLAGPELISSGPGTFTFCRPSYIRRVEPQGVLGRGALTLWGVNGGTPVPLPGWAAAASGWRGHCCFSTGAS